MKVFTITPSEIKATISGLEIDWHHLRNGKVLPPQEVNGIPVHRVRVPDRGTARYYWFGRGLAQFCRTCNPRPDVVQLLSLRFAHVPALIRLRRLGVPTVFTKTMVTELPDNPLKRVLLRRYWTLPLRFVSCVVVSSGVMREKLEDLGARVPIEVIPNGVDTLRFRPPGDERERVAIRQQYGIRPDDAVALYVGPVSPRKGVDLLLESWNRMAEQHPRLHLMVVGPRMDAVNPAHEAFRRRLEGLLNDSGAADRVHFIGLVENVEDYMRAADVFLFTSRREGMPNVVPEAMASGLPVVTTPFVGFPEEFGMPGRQYLLADFDATSYANAVGVILTHERLGRQIGTSARAWIERNLTVDRSLDLYSELYRDLSSVRNGDGV